MATPADSFPVLLLAALLAAAPGMAQPQAPEAAPGPGADTGAEGEVDEGEVIDRVVALVRLRGDHAEGARPAELITLSDLEFEGAIALVQRGGVGAATATLDPQTLQSTLEYTIAQRLHILEADRLGAFRVEPAELDAAEHAFESRFDSPSQLERFLDAHDADRRRLRSVLERGLRAAKILDSKVRLKAQVTDAEARRHYDAHAEPGGKSFEELRAALREKLFREKYQRLAAAESAKLRQDADVRIISPLVEGP